MASGASPIVPAAIAASGGVRHQQESRSLEGAAGCVTDMIAAMVASASAM